MSVRTEKVASLVKQELSVIFQRNFGIDQFGFLTITEVRMSPDLKVAKVYVSVFGDDLRKQTSMDMLEQEKGFIRSELGHAIRLKFTPSLIFYLDESLDRAMNISKILNDLQKDSSKEKDEERNGPSGVAR